jgi:hypothetical protein
MGLIFLLFYGIIYIKEGVWFEMHIVKCPICGKDFDRDKIPNRQMGRRYAHIECWARKETMKTQDEKDRESLEEYIMNLFGLNVISPKIKRQIDTYHNEYNYTYTGIKKALIYQFEVKKGDLKQANGGIGIVPYVYDQARNYYYQIWLAQQRNDGKVLEDYVPKVVKIYIDDPVPQPKRRNLFSFLDEEEGDAE